MSESKRKQPMGAVHMKSMTNVFMKLFDTLEQEHLKLQALELRRVQLTQEMRLLHETLKKQNQELRIAENAQRERVYKAQRQLKKSSESGMSGRGSPSLQKSGSKTPSYRINPTNVKQVASLASINHPRNVGATGILGKSQGGSKSAKNFSLGSPPSRTTTFTVDSPPSTTTVVGKAHELSHAGSRVSTVSSSGKKLKSKVQKLANEATKKVIQGSNKSLPIVKPPRFSETGLKKTEKTAIKTPPKPALKSRDSLKDPSKSSRRSSVSIPGAKIMGMNPLMKNIISTATPPPPPPPPPPSTLRKVLATFGWSQVGGTHVAPNRLPASLNPATPAAAAESTGAPPAPSALSTTTAATTLNAPAVEMTPITSITAPGVSSTNLSANTDQSIKLPDTPNSKSETVPKKSNTVLSEKHSVHIIKEPRSMPDASQSQLDVIKAKKPGTKIFPLSGSSPKSSEPEQSQTKVLPKEKPKTKERKDKMEPSASSEDEVSQ